MKPDYEITDSGIYELRARILEVAAKRHRFLIMKRYKKNLIVGPVPQEIKELEDFFLSYWGQLLSGFAGQYIIDKDYDIAREELDKERRKNG